MIVELVILILMQLSGAVKCDDATTDSGKTESCTFTNDSTGILESKGFFLNGKTHGTQRHWYASGKLKSETNYRNDVMVDTSRSYFESGKLSGLTVCDHNGNVCTWTMYLPDGRFCGEERTRMGKSVGRSWTKYADGNWRQISEYDDNGKKDGLHAHWDSLGRPVDSIVYIHDAILRASRWYPNSTQLDVHWSYDSLDVVHRKETPRVREAAWFGPDGKSWGKVVNGNGVLRFYYEGTLDRTDTYKGGVVVKSMQSKSPQPKKKEMR